MWWDEALQAGEVFDEAIEAALNAAKAVVVLWSPDSAASRWVRAEATVADQNNSLLPVTIRPCRRPVIFELTQTVDLSNWKGNRRDRTWRAFVDEVRKFISADAQEKRALAAARTEAPARNRSSQREGLQHPQQYWVIAALAAIAILAGGAFWWLSPGKGGESGPLYVSTFQAKGGAGAEQFAQTLKLTAVDAMTDAGIPSSTDESGARKASGMILHGTVRQVGSDLRIFAQLDDARSGVNLWAQQFDGPASDPDRLSTSVAVAATEPLYTLREINLQRGLALSPADLAKLMKGMQMINNPRLLDEGRLRQAFENAVSATPNLAYAHAMLALTLVQDGARSPADQRSALFDEARSAASDAIKLSPAASGAAYDSLYLMSVYSDRGKLVRQENRLLDGLRNASGFAFLSMRECQFLMAVGRNEDAWPYCQRAHAMRPLSSPIGWRFAEALKMRGEQAAAEQAIDEASHYYDNAPIRLAKFDILAFGAGHDRAAALVPAMLNQSEDLGDAEIDALKLYLQARKSGSASDVAKAAAAISAAASQDHLRLDLAIKALASLGRLDQAFALLGVVDHPLPPQMDLASGNAGTSFLFAPETAPLRTDKRFWIFAKRQGLVDYWVARGKWPDFCGREVPVKNCQQEAARVHGT